MCEVQAARVVGIAVVPLFKAVAAFGEGVDEDGFVGQVVALAAYGAEVLVVGKDACVNLVAVDGAL